MLSSDRRKEIAAFLRTRRAQLQPEQVGLPRGTRRRTPGLRREEVAALAGVSVEWYTWLEQARDVRPSPDTLRRISSALRLEPAQSQHLFALSGHGAESWSSGAGRDAAPSWHLQRLMDHLEPCPAWVSGQRWDILAWNRAATIIYGDLAALEGIERNAMFQLFLNPHIRRTLVDWEAHARDCVAKMRLDHGRYVDDPWFNELIHLLRTRCDEFAAWWDEHNVRLPHDGVKRYDHPEVGRLTFNYASLNVSSEDCAPLSLTTYMAAPGTDTQEKVEALLRRPSPDPFPVPAARADRAQREPSIA